MHENIISNCPLEFNLLVTDKRNTEYLLLIVAEIYCSVICRGTIKEEVISYGGHA